MNQLRIKTGQKIEKRNSNKFDCIFDIDDNIFDEPSVSKKDAHDEEVEMWESRGYKVVEHWLPKRWTLMVQEWGHMVTIKNGVSQRGNHMG